MRLRAGSSDLQSLITFVFVTLAVLAGVGVWFTTSESGGGKADKPSFQSVKPTDEPREIECPTCKGQLRIPCYTCQRMGAYWVDPKTGMCPTCQGTKVSGCDQCKGKGTIALGPQPGLLKWGGDKKP